MDVLIFIIRLLFSLLLYVFLGALFFLLWRDLKAATRDPVTDAARERPGQLRVLRGCDGVSDGSIIRLVPFTTIGRSDSNTITISDPYASGEHALVAWRSGQWWLEDRDSRNGTLLNEIPVEEALIIGHGDVIGVGQMRFKFEYRDALEADVKPVTNQSETTLS
jgi:pSer/pThr/pTyr-binding forkhead associated (FHA) protein